ncbi:hypothetical protein [Priestia taiwanensis]|uniref:hypothetical protein n=1 Tax=Priestia taiwanensis TaxID=1347902 RepID=UPI00166E914F|nr:hypothetical protein [Priestia taiwanensis]MBM7362058.1 signal transduction histidine kinase [Priestia taiwanensis]
MEFNDLYFISIFAPLLSIYLLLKHKALILGFLNLITWVSFFIVQFSGVFGVGGDSSQPTWKFLLTCIIIINTLFLCISILYYMKFKTMRFLYILILAILSIKVVILVEDWQSGLFFLISPMSVLIYAINAGIELYIKPRHT